MSPKLFAPTLTASVFAVVLSWGFPAMGAGDVTFGPPSFQSENNIGSISFSDDKKAFTMNFSGLEVGQSGGNLPTPIVTRVFSVVFPISGGEQGVEIPFHFAGASAASEGADVYAVFSVNGQTSTVNFPPGGEKDYTQTLVFKAASASEARLTIVLVGERDAKHPDGAAFLNVLAIDSDTTPGASKAHHGASKAHHGASKAHHKKHPYH